MDGTKCCGTSRAVTSARLQVEMNSPYHFSKLRHAGIAVQCDLHPATDVYST